MNFEKYSKENIQFYEINEIFPLLKNSISSLKKPIRLIDIGCGDGNLLNQLWEEKIIDKDDEIVALDPSQERLDRIKHNFKKVKAFGDKTGLKKDYFDYVICSQVIEHVPNDNILIKEIKNILKKDGLCFVSSVVKKGYGIYIYKKDGKFVSDPTHEREYNSKKEFEELLKEYFKIEKVNMHLFKHPLTDLILKLFIKLKVLNPDNINKIYIKSKIMRILRKIKVPLIGFYYIEALIRK